MVKASEIERITIGHRVPGIFRFQALLSFGLGIWMFYPLPINSIKGNAVVGDSCLVSLYFDGQVSYTSDGIYIRPLDGGHC